MRQSMLPLDLSVPPGPGEARGVVYTKPWVVELILDLAGYRSEANLVDSIAVEPAAGTGSFLVPMARRLIASCRRQGRPMTDCERSLLAYEIDDASAQTARRSIVDTLEAGPAAEELASGWVRSGDYLLDAPRLPAADFVVGNPPYIRLEDIPAETARFYRASYPTMTGRADLYVAFFEAALRQLKTGGVCAFICADRWMFNQYGADLRRLITSRHHVRCIVEMHGALAFDSEVSAYPAIAVIGREAKGKAVVARMGSPEGPIDTRRVADSLREIGDKVTDLAPILSSTVVESWFEGDEPWPCSSPGRLGLLRRLESRFGPLEDGASTRVGIGVATGCDKVFVTRDRELVEPGRLLPLAMASDIVTGQLEWSRHYLVDPWEEGGLVDLSSYPRLQSYFEQHRTILSGRHTAKRNPGAWYRTIDRVTHSLTSTPKLYIHDIKDYLNPVLDPGTTYPHHNLYFICSRAWDLEVLGGILLSAIGQFFVESYGVRMRGGYFRFQAQYLRRIRVPDPKAVDRSQAEGFVRAFRSRDRDLATRLALELYGVEARELEDGLES